MHEVIALFHMPFNACLLKYEVWLYITCYLMHVLYSKRLVFYIILIAFDLCVLLLTAYAFVSQVLFSELPVFCFYN